MQPSKPATALIFAITATGITANTLIAPVLPDIVQGLGEPAGAAGLVIGATTLPGVVLAPVIGVLADRYGRRAVLLPCLVVFGCAGGLGAFAGSLEMLVVLRFLQGAGSAGLINLAVVLIGDHWEGAARSRLIGRNAAVLTVCLTTFPVLGGALGELAWQWVFTPYWLALGTAAVLWRRLPDDHATGEGRIRDQFRRVLPGLGSPSLIALVAGGLLAFALIFGLLLTVLPLYLAQAFGLGSGARGLILAVPAVPNTATALALGRLRTRFNRRSLLLSGAGLFATGLATVGLASAVVGVVAGIFLFGIGEGLVVPTLQDLATGSAPPGGRGTMVALFVSASRLGQTLGPIGAAALAAGAGGPPAAFAVGAVVAVGMGVVLAIAARRTA